MQSEQPPPVLIREPQGDVSVFFSYARQDKWLRDELEKHLSNLKYRGLITTWHDQEIKAGEEREQQIDIYLNKAQVILLLISADFMASEYCYGKEMKHALERQERGEARVIPILLRPVDFTDAPFAKLQMLPPNRKPIMEWQNRDSAFVDITNGIERVAKQYSLQLSALDSAEKKGEPASVVVLWSLLSPLSIGIFIIGLIVAGTLALSLHPNLIPAAIAFIFSLLATSIFVSLKYFVRLTIKIERREMNRISRQVTFAISEDISFQMLLPSTMRDQGAVEAFRRCTYYNDAVFAYHLALLRSPFDGEAFRGMGNALYALEYYDKALNAFQQAVSYDPTPTAYAGLANTFAKLERYGEAISAYEKAIALDPTVTFNYEDLIQSLLVLRKKEEAEQAHATAKQVGYYEATGRSN